MTRWPYALILGLSLVLLLASCGDRLVEVATDHGPAVVVPIEGPLRCPSGTVLLSDDDPASGAGAIPDGFEGRTVLRCEVDYTTMRSRNGVDLFTIRQWQGVMTRELQTALALPDREFRPHGVACAASSGSTTALYVIDDQRRGVRVRPPTDAPCQVIRKEAHSLLPSNTAGAFMTFDVSRKTR